MKSLKYIFLTFILFVFSGCDLYNDMFSYKYSDENENFSKPNKIIFQSESDPKKAIISSKCKYNMNVKYIYYKTPDEADSNYFSDTNRYISVLSNKKTLKPFWDIRYTNRVSSFDKKEYADLSLAMGIDARGDENSTVAGSDNSLDDSFASAVQALCIDKTLAAGATINLKDSPNQDIKYAGPQATFMYRLSDKNVSKPWTNIDGNLMIQAFFKDPIYKNFEKNVGASISFGVMLKNRYNSNQINYIIGLYSSGESWVKEQTNLKYDPTTHMIHVGSVAIEDAIWTTLSPRSQTITKIHSNKDKINRNSWDSFFRINISYKNLKNVLTKLKINPPKEAEGLEFGLNPQDWYVSSIYIQYEVEEEGGKALISGAFKGFEAYISKLPL